MPKHLFVPVQADSRRFAISDIHGCNATFNALLSKIDLQPTDQLFLLGDFVNRGNDSLKVIKTILTLQDEGYQIYCLRGNHEQMILDVLRRWPLQLKAFLKKYGSADLLNKEGRLRSKVFDFLQECLYYIELDDYYLVHAGFDFKSEKPLKSYSKMLSIRKYTPDYEKIKHKKIVHGHYRHSIEFIERQALENKMVLPIDCGCSAKKIKGQGNLVCLNLDTLEITSQRNIEPIKAPKE